MKRLPFSREFFLFGEEGVAFLAFSSQNPTLRGSIYSQDMLDEDDGSP